MQSEHRDNLESHWSDGRMTTSSERGQLYIAWYHKGTGLLLTEGAPGIEIGRQSIDDSGGCVYTGGA